MSNYGVIENREKEVIARALAMAAIDEEAAALVLEAMIVKKDAAMRDLAVENNMLVFFDNTFNKLVKCIVKVFFAFKLVRKLFQNICNSGVYNNIGT